MVIPYRVAEAQRQAGRGWGAIDRTGRRELLNRDTRSDASELVVVPLDHEGAAFGVLLAGRCGPDAKARPAVEGSVDGVVRFARRHPPDLHAWLAATAAPAAP